MREGEQRCIPCAADGCHYDKFFVRQHSITGVVEAYCADCGAVLLSAQVAVAQAPARGQGVPI